MNNLISKFSIASIIAATASGINLLATITILKYYGTEVYTDYIVELAILAILFLAYEFLPSNHLVFKLQEISIAKNFVVSINILSTLIIVLILFAKELYLEKFSTNILVLAAYAFGYGLRRYNDIFLQSINGVEKIFILDSIVSLTRLVLLVCLPVIFGTTTMSVWSALIVPTIIIHGWFFIKGKVAHGEDKQVYGFGYLRKILEDCSWAHYGGITLKKITDSLITITAEMFISNRDLLAAFFVVNRSVNFSSIASRIYEAIMNVRENTILIARFQIISVVSISALTQILTILLAYVIFISSGLEVLGFWYIFATSLICWPITLISNLRARLLGNYASNPILLGYLVYLITFGLLFIFSTLSNFQELSTFIFVMIISKCVHATFLQLVFVRQKSGK